MDESVLEKLAISFGSDFLKVLRNPDNVKFERVIGLYGTDDHTLTLLKKHMIRYFKENKEEVLVTLSKKGYTIDVGYFLTDKTSLNTALRLA